MAPQKTRALHEDTRSEVSNGRERHTTLHPSGVSKGKRPAAMNLSATGIPHKDPRSAPSVEVAPASASGAPTAIQNGGVNWRTLPNSALHAYRHAHRLPAPPAFASAHSALVLSDPAGLGRYSPTMAWRERARRRASKETLAQAVRRDFNAAPVNEMDAITSFVYAVKNQNKSLKAQFPPGKAK